MARVEQRGNFNFKRKMAQLQKMKIDMPIRVANTAKNHFISEFKKSSWEGNAWKPRADLRNPRKLLVKSGRLQKSLYNSLKRTNWRGILFYVDTPYAGVHNNGLMAGRGKGFRMPKRQFIGDSKTLRLKIRKLIDMAVKQAMR